MSILVGSCEESMRCTDDQDQGQGPTDDVASLQRSVHSGVEEEVKITVHRPSSPSLDSTAPVSVAATATATASAVDEEDSDPGSQDRDTQSEEELSEYIEVDIQSIRKQVQCAVCLGIIKKTRTMMECMHRFCRECIDKAMRIGNNECPACRTHCASRRSLKDDPRYDLFIKATFPDIDQYEEEELALCDEDIDRNKKIQASIAQILELQSEVYGAKQSSRKGKRPRYNKSTPSRRSKRRRSAKTMLDESDENEDLEKTQGQTSSFSDDSKNFNQYRNKTRTHAGTSRPPSPAESSEMDSKIDQKTSHPGIMLNMEMRAWGRSSARSNIRNGNANVVINKESPGPHVDKLEELLQNLEKQDDECVASETPSGADKQPRAAIEIPGSHHKQDFLHLSSGAGKSSMSESVDPFRDRQPVSEEKKTHAGFKANCVSHAGQLVILACQNKETI